MLGRVESDQAHSAEETNGSFRQAGKIWEQLSQLHTADEGHAESPFQLVPNSFILHSEFILVV